MEQLFDPELRPLVKELHKTRFKLFDFFANCEYFEEKFDYDEVLKLPRPGRGDSDDRPESSLLPSIGSYESMAPDSLREVHEEHIGLEGMKIDRMFFEKFENTVKADPIVQEQVEAEHWDQVLEYVTANLFDKPQEYFNLEKLRKAVGVDRRLTLREILEKIFGHIPYFKSKDELLEDEFQKFVLDCQVEDAEHIIPMKYFFKAYATDGRLRDIIESKRLTDLNVNPTFGMADYRAVPPEWRARIPEYVKDYVPLNQFM